MNNVILVFKTTAMKYFHDITDDDFVTILINRGIYHFKGDAYSLNLNHIADNLEQEEEFSLNNDFKDELLFGKMLAETFLTDSQSSKLRRMILVWNKNDADVFAKKNDKNEFVIKVAFRLPFIKKLKYSF